MTTSLLTIKDYVIDTTTIENLHEWMGYKVQKYEADEFDKAGKCLLVYWDDSVEDKVDKMLDLEYRVTLEDINKKRSLKWIEKAKKVFRWKLGTELRLFTKCNSCHHFRVWKTEGDEYCSIIINKNGLVAFRVFNHYIFNFDDEYSQVHHSFFVVIDSIHNDNMID